MRMALVSDQHRFGGTHGKCKKCLLKTGSGEFVSRADQKSDFDGFGG